MEKQGVSPKLRKRIGGNSSGQSENPPPYEKLYPDPNVVPPDPNVLLPDPNVLPPPKTTTGIAAPSAALYQARIEYGPDSQRAVCPHCHAEVRSEVRATPTTKTHLAALLLFCCICWPCAWMPYCIDSCQNMNHYCPNCNAYLGTYES